MYLVGVDFLGIYGCILELRLFFQCSTPDCEVRHALRQLKFKEKKRPFVRFYATLVVTQLLLPLTYDSNFFNYISISPPGRRE